MKMWKNGIVGLTIVLSCVLILELVPYFLYPLQGGKSFNRALLRARVVTPESPFSDSVLVQPDMSFHYGEALHPYLGFTGDAGLDTVVTGKYGSDYDHEAAGDTAAFVVAVTGGSVAMQFASRTNMKSMRAEVEGWPEMKGRRVHFVSYSYAGYKQPQQLMGLLYFLSLGDQFDVLVNLDGYNDLMLARIENYPSGVNPFYPRSWNFQTSSAIGTNEIRVAATIMNLREERENTRRRFSWWLPRNSNFLLSLWEGRDNRIMQKIMEGNTALRTVQSREKYSFQSHGPKFTAADDGAYLMEMIRYWGRCSVMMHQVCEANRIRYHHFLQPNQYVPGSKTMGEEESRTALMPAGEPARKLMTRYYPELAAEGERLRQLGLPFTDLTTVFRDITEPLYVDPCCHVNEKGNELMRAVILKKIREGL
jgi:hypothetical protein